MKYLVNNYTTYNYSHYATRPKWLITFEGLYSIQKEKKKLKIKQKNIKTGAQIASQCLFQTKELLCWTSDLSFFNLRGYFSNILKALQICRVAARNNRKVLFIKGDHSTYGYSTQLNPWLQLQHQREILPQKLSNILNVSYLPANQPPMYPLKVDDKFKIPENAGGTNSNSFYQLNGLLNSCFAKVATLASLKIQHGKKISAASSLVPSTVHLGYKTKITVNNMIKLQVKETQIISQRTAETFGSSLVGFLTNSKIAFNTAYSLSNYNFYCSTFCPEGKENGVLSKKNHPTNSCKVKINRLEKIVAIFIPKTKHKNEEQQHSSNATINAKSFLNLNKSFKVKKQWAEYCYYNYYLSLVSNNLFFKKISSNLNKSLSEKVKKQKLIEHGVLGDILAWQPKFQNASSAFYFSDQNKEGEMAVSLVRQQQLLKQLPILLKESSYRFLKSKKVIHLKQNTKKKQFRFVLMGRFIINILPFTKIKITPLKRIKSQEIKQFKKNKKSTIKFTSFPLKKSVVFLKRIIAFKNNCKIRNRPAYRYNAPLNNFSTFFKKKRIIKKKGTNKNKFRNKIKNKALLNKHSALFNNALFCEYYKTILNSSYLKQYEMFAKTPFLNNQLADIIFFINPENSEDLVNQANSLKIPTVGIVSGITRNGKGRSNNNSRLKESIYYPILGNPTSDFFTHTVINLFVKALQAEKYKMKTDLIQPKRKRRNLLELIKN